MTQANADVHKNAQISARAFTDKWLRGLKPADAIYEVRDAACPGLVLRVTTRGRKVWEVIVGCAAKRRRVRLGEFPTLSLTDARRSAGERKGAPAGTAHALRGRDLWKMYHAEIATTHRAVKDVEMAWNGWAEPLLGDVRIEDVNLHHGVELVNRVSRRSSRNRAGAVIRYIRPMFRWAAGRGLIPGNPFAGLVLPKGAEKRDRVLRADEWARIGEWSAAAPYPWGPFIRTMMLSAQRLNEVAAMRWDEMDGDIWTIPADRHKSKKKHEVPLSRALRLLIEAQPRHEVYVFSTRKGVPIRPADKLKQQISAEAGIADWRFHDIRRTGATLMGDAGVPRFTIERALGHADHSVTATYDRALYRREKRAALEALAATLEPKETDGAVVPIRRRADDR